MQQVGWRRLGVDAVDMNFRVRQGRVTGVQAGIDHADARQGGAARQPCGPADHVAGQAIGGVAARARTRLFAAIEMVEIGTCPGGQIAHPVAGLIHGQGGGLQQPRQAVAA